MDKILKKIFDSIIKELSSIETDEGIIKANKSNFDYANKLKDIIEKILKDEGYYDELLGKKSEFEAISKDNLKLYDAKISNNIKAYNDLVFENFFNSFSGDFVGQSIIQPVKDALISNLTGNGNIKDLKNIVRQLLDEKKISGRFNVLVDEIYSVYQRSQGLLLAKEKGIKYFRYAGGKKDTTRPFCEQRIRNIYTLEEIEKWSNLDWSGKNENTTPSNIAAYLGGYNCRHVLIPVSEEMALSSGRLNIYNKIEK